MVSCKMVDHEIMNRFVIRRGQTYMSETISFLAPALGLTVLAALLLYLRAKRRRQAADRLDRMERDLPEFLRNPKPSNGNLNVPDVDLSLDIHPWGDRPRRPRTLDRR